MAVLAEAVLQCLGDPILPMLQRDLQTSQEVFHEHVLDTSGGNVSCTPASLHDMKHRAHLRGNGMVQAMPQLTNDITHEPLQLHAYKEGCLLLKLHAHVTCV